MKKEEKGRKNNAAMIVLVSLFMIAVGFTIYPYFFSIKDPQYGGWQGAWNISYFYKDNPTLLFEGTMVLDIRGDSIYGEVEIFPPKSVRPIKLSVEKLKISTDNKMISGVLVYHSFKIRGGYLKETFELYLEELNEFRGNGSCLEYCAEGTEGAEIIWNGERIENN